MAKVIEGKKMPNTILSCICCGQTLRMSLSCPMCAIVRAEFQWAKFVEADNVRTLWDGSIQSF